MEENKTLLRDDVVVVLGAIKADVSGAVIKAAATPTTVDKETNFILEGDVFLWMDKGGGEGSMCW